MRALILLLFLSACESTYGVRIAFVDEAARASAQNVQVVLVESCSAQELGSDAVDPIREVSFDVGETSPELGTAEPGDYGLYARAIDDSCSVVAAGCTPVTLEAGGDAGLVVELSTVSRSLCRADEMCRNSRCESGDGGGVDSGMDGGVDAGPPDSAVDSGADSGRDAAADAEPIDGGNDAGPSDGGSDASVSPLVAHYACEAPSVVTDSSGNGHDGTCVDICPVFTTGLIGQGCEYNAIGHIEVPYDAAFDPAGGFSVAVWVFPFVDDRFESVVGMPLSDGDSNTWQLYLERLLLSFVTDHGMGTHFQRTATIAVDDWTHVVLTYDGDVKTIYIDGERQSFESQGPISVDGGNIIIGADRNAGAVAHRFRGIVDELKIYNRALTVDEALEVFTER